MDMSDGLVYRVAFLAVGEHEYFQGLCDEPILL